MSTESGLDAAFVRVECGREAATVVVYGGMPVEELAGLLRGGFAAAGDRAPVGFKSPAAVLISLSAATRFPRLLQAPGAYQLVTFTAAETASGAGVGVSTGAGAAAAAPAAARPDAWSADDDEDEAARLLRAFMDALAKRGFITEAERGRGEAAVGGARLQRALARFESDRDAGGGARARGGVVRRLYARACVRVVRVCVCARACVPVFVCARAGCARVPGVCVRARARAGCKAVCLGARAGALKDAILAVVRVGASAEEEDEEEEEEEGAAAAGATSAADAALLLRSFLDALAKRGFITEAERTRGAAMAGGRALQAAYAAYARSRDVAQLKDAIIAAVRAGGGDDDEGSGSGEGEDEGGAATTRVGAAPALVRVVRGMRASGEIDASEEGRLVVLIARGDEYVYAAWEVYESHDGDEDELRDTLRRIARLRAVEAARADATAAATAAAEEEEEVEEEEENADGGGDATTAESLANLVRVLSREQYASPAEVAALAAAVRAGDAGLFAAFERFRGDDDFDTLLRAAMAVARRGAAAAGAGGSGGDDDDLEGGGEDGDDEDDGMDEEADEEDAFDEAGVARLHSALVTALREQVCACVRVCVCLCMLHAFARARLRAGACVHARDFCLERTCV
jgi:hypothetical protein